MKTFTVNIDDKLDNVLDELKASMGQTSRAEVFRLAVTLLKLAEEANRQGLKLAIADDEKVRKEILLPGFVYSRAQDKVAAAAQKPRIKKERTQKQVAVG